VTIPTVRLFLRPGCHLCDRVEELLEEISLECPLDLEQIDITTDIDIFERYRYEIPVVAVEGGGTVSGRIAMEDLRRILRLGPPRSERITNGGEPPTIPSKRQPQGGQ
jgi:glutaredoxin